MVYGRNLVYTMSDLWSFVDEEETHKEAMKTVIGLNYDLMRYLCCK